MRGTLLVYCWTDLIGHMELKQGQAITLQELEKSGFYHSC
jgi:hypothetical protein